MKLFKTLSLVLLFSISFSNLVSAQESTELRSAISTLPNELVSLTCGSGTDATSINFQSGTYYYEMYMPYNTTNIAAFTYVKNHSEQTVLIGKSVIGKTTNITVKSNIDGVADTHYSVLLKKGDYPASLNTLSINNGGKLLPEFNKETTEYIAIVNNGNEDIKYSTDESNTIIVEGRSTTNKRYITIQSKSTPSLKRTYSIYVHYAKDIIPNGEFSEWESFKVKDSWNSKKWTSQPKGWFEPAWADHKIGLDYLGSEIESGDNNVVNFSNKYNKTAGGAIPPVLFLGDISGEAKVANGSYFEMTNNSDITFRNSPDNAKMKYKQARPTGNGIKFYYYFDKQKKGEHNNKTSQENYEEKIIKLDASESSPVNMSIAIIGNGQFDDQSRKATGTNKPSYYTSDVMAKLDYIRFEYNNGITSAKVNNTTIAISSDKKLSANIPTEYNGTPTLNFTGQVIDQAFDVQWKTEVNGKNTATVKSYGEDGQYTEYTINTTRELSAISTVNNILVNGAKVTGFNPETTNYTYIICDKNQLPDVQVNPMSPHQKIDITYSGNQINIKSTSETGSIKNYTINCINSYELYSLINAEDVKSAYNNGENAIFITETYEPFKVDYENGSSICCQPTSTQQQIDDYTARLQESYSQLFVYADTIVWNGSVDNNWDNRANYTIQNTKARGLKLNARNAKLFDSLTVIIPGPHSEKYPYYTNSIKNYPTIPSEFSDDRKNNVLNYVSAGQTPTKFANEIIIEDGGCLLGTENLVKGDTKYYTRAQMSFKYSRSEWVLTGSSIKPFKNGKNGAVRETVSGDFYLNYQPHVYMHEAVAQMKGNDHEIIWNNPFTNMYVTIPNNKAFAIKLPNRYGNNKDMMFTSDIYYKFFNKDESKINDGTKDITYTFKGRFNNDSILPKYTNLKKNQAVLLSNTYTCNINPFKIEGLGTVQLYYYNKVYANGSFQDAKEGETIKPQQAFVFIPNEDMNTFEITSDMFVQGDTHYRGLTDQKPNISITAKNNDSKKASFINIKYDEFKGNDEEKSNTDSPKIFASTVSDVPELYIMMYNEKLVSVDVANAEQIIPLGLRLDAKSNVEFALVDSKDFETATLEDRETGESYDLLSTEGIIIENLPQGDIEGRFFINTTVGYNEDDEVVTDIIETETENNISVYFNNNILTISASQDNQLQKAIISDMSGRSIDFELSGNYETIQTELTTGIYIVNILSDKQTYSTKICVK